MNSPRRPRRRVRSPDRQPRYTGKIVLALLIASVGLAVGLAEFYSLGVPLTVMTITVGGGAPSGLYLAWVTYKEDQRPEEEPKTQRDQGPEAERKTLAPVADKLAESITEQWRDEVVVRQFNDYSQLSVSWAAADPALTVSWKDLVGLAEHGPGRPAPPPAGTWAAGPEGLAGLEDQLPDVLKRVPTGWLLVLGEPGAGKTMLMVRLVLDLLARRTSGEPVPVLVPITSWDPVADDLHTWLQDRLTIDHPGLASHIPIGDGGNTRIGALLADQMIVPILDGLDEMPLAARRAAISKLNETLSRPACPQQLLVTCRAAEYQEAVSQHGHGRIPLRGAAAIELRPLGAEDVKRYLTDDGEDTRWNPVVRGLGRRTAVGKALRTPLFVSLAAAVYNPHSNELPAEVPNPAALCKREHFPTPEAIQDHLIQAFIPAVYRADQRRAGAAERQLASLASYLQNDRKMPSLQWWDLAPPKFVPVVVGTVCGIAAATAAAVGTHVGVGIGIGFGTGMLAALGIGRGIRWAVKSRNPVRYAKDYKENFRPGPGIAGALLGAAIGGVCAGVAGKLGIGHEASLFSGLPEALGIGIGGGASARFVGGLTGGLLGAFAGGLLEGVGLGLPAGLVNGLGVGLAAGLAVYYAGRRVPAGKTPEWVPKIGISGGLVVGVVIGLIAWREEGILAGLGVGAVIGAAASWPLGLRDTEQNLKAVPSPGRALATDACAFRRTAMAGGLAAACAGFLGGSLASIFEIGAKVSLNTIVSNGLGIGLSSGLIIALAFGTYHAASPGFMIISWWLALRRKTPWRLMRFLNDAHKKSILRQSGADFQFRHESLKEYLVTTAAAKGQAGNSSQAGANGMTATDSKTTTSRPAATNGKEDAESRVSAGGKAGASSAAPV